MPRLAAVRGAQDAELTACHHRAAAPVPRASSGERTTGRTPLPGGALRVSVTEQSTPTWKVSLLRRLHLALCICGFSLPLFFGCRSDLFYWVLSRG